MILRSSSGLAASTLLALTSVHAADTAKPASSEKDPFAPAENYITISGQYNGVSGDEAAFQAKNWTAKNGFGGIEDFRFGKSLKHDFEIKADGHALVGNADYLAHINVSKNEFGSVDAGYSRFRTYYDGIGGFFPSNKAWFPLVNQDLHVDRSKLWAQASLTLPNLPTLTVRYTHETRDGTKDSTIWGDTSNTGIPISSVNANNPVAANRKIIASYIDLDEKRQTLEGTIKHTFGKTTVQGSVIGETIDNVDTRYLNKYPGEARPAGGAAPAFWLWSQGSNAINGYHTQGVKTNALTFLVKAETVLSDDITAFAGVSYQHSTTDFTGSRPLTTSIAVGTIASYSVVQQYGGYATGGRAPGSYQDFTGGSRSKRLTANVGVDVKVVDTLFIETALKVEDLYTQSDDALTYNQYLVNQTTGVVTNNSLGYSNASKITELAWIPELSVRYTGMKDVSMYGSADYRHVPGTENTAYRTSTNLLTNADVTENHGNYTVGANWIPNSNFTGRIETFYKNHRNSFNANVSTAPTDKSQFILGSRYSGTRLSATVKILPTLTSTTRYVYQAGKMDLGAVGTPVVAATSSFTRYASYETADSISRQISETIDWTPVKQVYLQANLNIAFDTMQTAYPKAGGRGNDVIRNADNNYWNASLLIGFVVDKVTNAEFQYTHYRADNFKSETWITQPYGAGAKNYTATVAVKRKLTDKLLAELKVGYLSSRNDTSGGNTDYTARVAYVSLQQAF
ncbi:MAG: hypothetical protein IPP19_09815 [Verrucomicrobia bacterium]|nr:hypothetical protein [Verrucomicrobiota bacterium]